MINRCLLWKTSWSQKYYTLQFACSSLSTSHCIVTEVSQSNKHTYTFLLFLVSSQLQHVSLQLAQFCTSLKTCILSLFFYPTFLICAHAVDSTHLSTARWQGPGSDRRSRGKARFRKAFLYASRGIFCRTLSSSMVTSPETAAVVVAMAGTMRPAIRLILSRSTCSIEYIWARRFCQTGDSLWLWHTELLFSSGLP